MENSLEKLKKENALMFSFHTILCLGAFSSISVYTPCPVSGYH